MRAGRFISNPALTLILLAVSAALITPVLASQDRVVEGRAPSSSPPDPSLSFTLTPEILSHEIDSRMHRIAEFEALRRWGTHHGIRVWAAGGTASGLAIYVKQHLENEWLTRQGRPPKYFNSRFGYNYFEVYRSTQDADIVIDGTEADARALEKFLRENFNYLQGSKELWEVRLLRQPRGSGEAEKDPLLGFDFQNQNSDSYSTGMVEITDPPPGNSRIRDLFAWESRKTTPFLRDLVSGTVSFIRNPRHHETKRARKGMNPEIISVIRGLTKAFQYEARITPDDEKELRSIISRWNPLEQTSSYVANTISKNGQKLFWHSPNVERAWDDLERLGLRVKLIEFGKTNDKQDLSTWLDREPLRVRSLGTTGETARELGITVVAHETNSFLAYENILRSSMGKPNVFVSRPNRPGEAAAHGAGFYTRPGRSGARGTGLTIRYQINPEARVDADFIHLKDQVVVLNAAALTTLEESLNLDPVDLLDLILSHQLSGADKGLLERFRLLLRSSRKAGKEAEYRLILALLDATIGGESHKNFKLMVDFIATHPKNQTSPLLDACIRYFDQLSTSDPARLSSEVLSLQGVLDIPVALNWINHVVKDGTPHEIRRLLTLEAAALHPDFESWVDQALEHHPEYATRHILSMTHVRRSPRFTAWIDRALEMRAEGVLEVTLKNSQLLESPHYERWVQKALQWSPALVSKHLLSQAWLSSHPRYVTWVDNMLDQHSEYVIRHVLTSKELVGHPKFDEWVERSIEKNVALSSWQVLGQEHLHTHPKIADWILEAIRRHPGAQIRTDLFDYTIHALIRQGRGDVFLYLCPVGKITAPRLRRILTDHPTGWDRCAMLLRPLMRAIR